MNQSAISGAGLNQHVAEMDALFAAGWTVVGHAAELAHTGDYFTIDLVGNLLVAVRARDRIRVLSRVCLHRWASLVEGAGNVRRFTCPFHAWTYGVDGKLIAAAFMEQAEGFDRSQCRLPEIRSSIDEASGLIFIDLVGDAPDLPSPKIDICADLAGAAASGPFQEEALALGWDAALERAQASPDSQFLAPNLVISPLASGILMQFLFPNGPEASVLRQVTLLK